uniref:BHLH domain-containing protein n=1 Tax=Pelodiscus sinensis TaxID=13735 RepID=K7FE91_PELSI
MERNEMLRLAMRYINFLVKVLGQQGLPQTGVTARGSILGLFQQASHRQYMEALTALSNLPLKLKDPSLHSS